MKTKEELWAYQKQWVSENRDRHNAAVRRYRARRSLREGYWRDTTPKVQALKAWMIELKSNPCTDCQQKFAVCCMDFDHKEGTEKKYNLGQMFSNHYNVDLIKAELAKCELVCANCHRIRTQKRKLGKTKYTKNDI